MTPLEKDIISMIDADGPLSMDRYMGLCLAHPEHGYYMTRDPFGRGGDFTTAPEVSQMFGELIGIWCVSAWQIMQAPDPFHLIEIGPGRGTLMADALRAMRIMPGLLDSVHLHLIETSPALRALQRETLAKSDLKIAWNDDIDAVPPGPSLIIGNEFFDALPVQQIQRGDDGWHERVIGLGEAGQLQIDLASDLVPDKTLPDWTIDAEVGEIAEISPLRSAYAARIAQRIDNHGGACLFIDYGHTRSGTGDTLQAVSKHEPVDILHRPGECDLTAHVDFAALKAVFDDAGLKTYDPISQSRFLAGMGLAERADMLSKRNDARQRMKIADGARRLVAGNEMGHLFKVLVATHRDAEAPAPFAQMNEPA